MKDRIKNLVDQLELQPHPEGGYFSEIYRNESLIHTKDGKFPDSRNICTSIYYLLKGRDKSLFHRIKSDEIWHHYEGAPVTIHTIFDDGLYRAYHLGKEIIRGKSPQIVIPAYTWFGVTVDNEESYSLCGCTVAPGFDFKDFELADRYMLLQAFPEHEAIIKELTQPIIQK